jgi:hypothetical protein
MNHLKFYIQEQDKYDIQKYESILDTRQMVKENLPDQY